MGFNVGSEWDKIGFDSLEMFWGQGHRQSPAIISIPEITLPAELTTAHGLIEGLINNLT